MFGIYKNECIFPVGAASFVELHMKSQAFELLFKNFRFGISYVEINNIVVIDALHTYCKWFKWVKCKGNQAANGL